MGTGKEKVFILIKGLGLGGAEKLLALSLPFLNRNRFQYEIGYLLPWKDALVPEVEAAGIPVHCLNQRKPYDFGVLTRLRRLLKERDVDLLHTHLPYAGVLGRTASRRSYVRAVVHTEHNVWERYHRVTSTMNRLTYSWNDAVIAVSREVEESIRGNLHINGRPALGTILNGVDVISLSRTIPDSRGVREEFGISRDTSIVVHVGNFTPKKRHGDLLQAAKLVVQQRSDVSFLLVGTGPLELAMKARARELGVESNVVFTGLRTDVPRLIAASDLFVLPSQYEGLPIALLEAMSIGVPVIASSVGGVTEVIEDDVDGMITEPLKPDLLANKILLLLNNSELGRRLSENGRRKAQQHFSIERMVREVEALYDWVLARKGDA